MAGPGEKLERLSRLLGREVIGLDFVMPRDAQRRMIKGSLSRVRDGVHGLTYRRLPVDLCARIERQLNVGSVYAMPFMLGEDLMGTVAIITDKKEWFLQSGVIEAHLPTRLPLPCGVNGRNRTCGKVNRKYRSLVENANDGIIIIQNGILKYANPKMASLDRSSVKRLIGSPITDHVHPDEVAKVTEMYLATHLRGSQSLLPMRPF